jgi:hypothetical protein
MPTVQMTQEDLGELRGGRLPCQAVRKYSRDNQPILDARRLLASSDANVAFGTDCGMFPFSQGIREFPEMVDGGLTPIRAHDAQALPTLVAKRARWLAHAIRDGNGSHPSQGGRDR